MTRRGEFDNADVHHRFGAPQHLAVKPRHRGEQQRRSLGDQVGTSDLSQNGFAHRQKCPPLYISFDCYSAAMSAILIVVLVTIFVIAVDFAYSLFCKAVRKFLKSCLRITDSAIGWAGDFPPSGLIPFLPDFHTGRTRGGSHAATARGA